MACQRKTWWLALWVVACMAGIPQAGAQPPTNWMNRGESANSHSLQASSHAPRSGGRAVQKIRLAARQATLGGGVSTGSGDDSLFSSPLGAAQSNPSDRLLGDDSGKGTSDDSAMQLKQTPEAMTGEVGESVLTPVPDSAWDGEGDFLEPPAPLCSSGSLINRGCYYTQLDVMYLNRAGPEGFNLGVDILGNAQTGQILTLIPLRTPEALGFQPGARATVGRFLGRDDKNRDYTLEATYLGGFDYSFERALLAQNNLIVSAVLGSPPGFNFATRQSFTYDSDLNSAEVNFRVSRRLGRDRMELNPVTGDWVRKSAQGPLPSVFMGFRGLGVEESFGYFSQGVRTVELPPVGGVNQTADVNVNGTYLVKTQNYLFGPQIGADVVWQTALWKFGVRAKGGAMVNFADQHSQVSGVNAFNGSDDPVPFAFQTQRSGHSMAFVGEVNLTGAYYLRPNVAIRATTDFMWINQAALAAEQLNFLNPLPVLVTGGDLLYTGGSLGLEIVW